jgi:Ca-activated chloride channel family protein
VSGSLRRRIGFLRLMIFALAALAALAAAAGAPPAPSMPAAGSAPAAAFSPAAPSRLADLDPKYRDFLEEVAPLISERERQVFLSLTRDYQRDEFIQKFWDVRDPFPQTPQNELRDAWNERLKLARERYGNVTEDRARVLLVFGQPGHVFHSRCAEVVLPLEVWSYDHTEHVRRRFTLVFVQDLGAVHGRYRLWTPSEGLASLLTLQQRSRSGDRLDAAALESCPEGSDIAGYLSEAVDEGMLETKGKPLPKPGDEWLSGFAAASVDLPPGAQALPAVLDISFPGRTGSRTVVQGLVRVERAAVQPQRLSDKSFYAFVVDGEVVRREELFEHFRYRFTFPDDPAAGAGAVSGTGAAPAPGTAAAAAANGGAEIPIVFQRYLRPGAYSLVLKVEDLGGKRYFRTERELEVPVVTAPPAAAELAAAAADAGATAGAARASSAPTPPTAALAEANAAIRTADQSIRLLPPPDGLQTGALRVDAVVAGGGIDHVRFLLDGHPALTKRRPPFSVDLNLGPQPRLHRIKALAEAPDGATLAEDELVLNAGPHRFAVHLLEPQSGRRYASSLRAEAKVEVPEGEKLDRLEIYRNDTLVATLYQPPWTQPVLIPDSRQLSYVRAVAYLADGNSSEDLVLVNSPNPGERVDVQLIELYTTVTDRRGRPVDGLTRDDFRVYEDGALQSVARFDRVLDLPIYAGVMLDTSGSMATELDTAVQAALGFFQKVIHPKDRAAVVTFNGQPNLAVRFTNDTQVLAGGLSGLQADGNTALYDSIIYTLYYFGGVRGKRAVVLLTDGKDEGSRFRFTDALEYAKHSGIAFYTIGLGSTAKQPDIRLKLEQLAGDTGGRAFFIDRAGELTGAYHDIESELRAQYLLAYQSSKQGNDGKFRTVEVKLSRSGLAARTVPGYYP